MECSSSLGAACSSCDAGGSFAFGPGRTPPGEAGWWTAAHDTERSAPAPKDRKRKERMVARVYRERRVLTFVLGSNASLCQAIPPARELGRSTTGRQTVSVHTLWPQVAFEGGGEMKRSMAVFASGFPFALLAIGCGGSSGGGEGGGAGSGSPNPNGPATSVGTGSGSDCTVTAANLAVSEAGGTVPSIVWSGMDYAIAWMSTAGEIRVAVLDAQGSKNDQVVALSAGVGSPSITHLASGGYLVVWREADGAASTVRARHVDESGAPQSSAVQLTTASTADSRPVTATTSAGVAVAWMDASDAFFGFTDGGNPVASKASLGGTFPALAAAKQGLGVAWTKGLGGQAGFARVSGPGGAIAPIWMNGQAANPAVANEDDRFAIAWEDTSTGTEQIRFALVGGDAKVQGPTTITRDGSSANWPHVAWTGSYSAVVYYQFRDGPPKIYMTMVGADLRPVGSDLEVSGDTAGKFPSIAWSGRDLGVAWAEPSGGIVRLSICNCPLP